MADFTRASAAPGPLPGQDGGVSSPDLVEIGLLLPSSQAAALIELSRMRRESVGQILRSIIHRELNTFGASSPLTYDSTLTSCRGQLAR